MTIVLTAAAAALLLGLVLAGTSGRTLIARRAGRHSRAGSTADGGPTARELARLGLPVGPAGAAVLITAPWCADCHATERHLRDLADGTGVSVVTLDATEHPDRLAPWHVNQAPTTFFVARAGATRARIGGAPRPGAIAAGLAALTGEAVSS